MSVIFQFVFAVKRPGIHNSFRKLRSYARKLLQFLDRRVVDVDDLPMPMPVMMMVIVVIFIMMVIVVGVVMVRIDGMIIVMT